MCVYFDQLTWESGKSLACQPVYHAAEIVELLRVIELSGGSALACNAVSKAQIVAAKSDKGKNEGNMIWKRNERIVKRYCHWCCAGDYRAITVWSAYSSLVTLADTIRREAC